MGEVSTSQWIQFFRNAGMPLNVAANYAIIFYDNRIQQDMLMDLSKEYLYDMGIRVMGDVIAILRYAKEYHNQMVKEKMIGQPGMPPHETAKKSSPVTRMLSHYTRPGAISARSSPVVQRKLNNTESNITVVSRNLPAGPVKRARINISSQSSEQDIKAKRAKLYQPVQDGPMQVKMPKGTTERSRKLLQLQQQQQSVKRSVFDRLGDSHVSSSTDVKFNKNTSSVFKRLGPSSSSGEVTTSTAADDDDDDGPLQYRGILKNLSSVKKTVRIQPAKTSVMSGKQLRLKTASSTSPTKSFAGRRTVLQSVKDLQASNVSQINKILTQNATQTPQQIKRIFKPTVGFKTGRGGRLGMTRTIATNLVTLKRSPQNIQRTTANARGRGKVISLRNNAGTRFGQNSRQSVFQRLGQQ